MHAARATASRAVGLQIKGLATVHVKAALQNAVYPSLCSAWPDAHVLLSPFPANAQILLCRLSASWPSVGDLVPITLRGRLCLGAFGLDSVGFSSNVDCDAAAVGMACADGCFGTEPGRGPPPYIPPGGGLPPPPYMPPAIPAVDPPPPCRCCMAIAIAFCFSAKLCCGASEGAAPDGAGRFGEPCFGELAGGTTATGVSTAWTALGALDPGADDCTSSAAFELPQPLPSKQTRDDPWVREDGRIAPGQSPCSTQHYIGGKVTRCPECAGGVLFTGRNAHTAPPCMLRLSQLAFLHVNNNSPANA